MQFPLPPAKVPRTITTPMAIDTTDVHIRTPGHAPTVPIIVAPCTRSSLAYFRRPRSFGMTTPPVKS
jgi:hypothetical protein